ncbi:hypothetical protein DFQ28_010423 [Apophysomyces sp. BC1034]|nr:hypothetical protein DFQ30_010043 [Apophysomyces sp. BC1015]KAG0184824.1 hypothetical protein DFQ28_010423 [Apophysomyces sp. BC1034]
MVILDLRWNLVNLETTYIDLGFEIVPCASNLLTHRMTGLWKTESCLGDVKHPSILQHFFNPVLKSAYEYHQFSGFQTLGGFAYHITSQFASGIGRYSLHKVIAYNKIKCLVYNRKPTGYRHSLDWTPAEIWNHSSSFDTKINYSKNIYREARNKTYGSRIEFRFATSKLDTNFYELYEHILNSSKSYSLGTTVLFT